MPTLAKAPSEIQPLLFNVHPLHQGGGHVLRHELAQSLSPVGTANAGDPVGFSLAVSHAGGIPFAVNDVCILFAQDRGLPLRDVRAELLVGKPEFEPLIRIALSLSSALATYQGPAMDRLRFAPSSGADYVMRTLWLFPETALLIDDLQYVSIERPEDLRYLAIGFYAPPPSRRALPTRCAELDAIFACAKQQITICYEGFRLDHDGDYEMSFAPIDPGQIDIATSTPGAL